MDEFMTADLRLRVLDSMKPLIERETVYGYNYLSMAKEIYAWVSGEDNKSSNDEPEAFVEEEVEPEIMAPKTIPWLVLELTVGLESGSFEDIVLKTGSGNYVQYTPLSQVQDVNGCVAGNGEMSREYRFSLIRAMNEDEVFLLEGGESSAFYHFHTRSLTEGELLARDLA